MTFSPLRPVGTYSIIARDPETGSLGVGVQSHWFSVGGMVPWARAGVGAVATQSLVDPVYGVIGMELMRIGKSASEALKSVLAGDHGRDIRQVAMVDARGRVAVHTGTRCISAAGHLVDDDHQFSVQANLVKDDDVWPAMAEAYRGADGDLADRLLVALEAAEEAGGDVRGRRSAALLVVAAKPSGKSWEDRHFNLCVEDHDEPVQEMKRLVQMQRAYHHMNFGDQAIIEQDFGRAREEYQRAEVLAPDVTEVPFWHAVALINDGRVDDALPIFKRVFARERLWLDLVPRLVESELLPNDENVLKRIAAQGA